MQRSAVDRTGAPAVARAGRPRARDAVGFAGSRTAAGGGPLAAVLPSTLVALQRRAGNAAVARLVSVKSSGPTPIVVSRRDTRTGTGSLSSGQIRDIGHEINPASAPTSRGGAPRLWDGNTGTIVENTVNRFRLMRELLTAMDGYLDVQMPSI